MRSVVAMALKDLLLISRDGMGVFFIIGFPVLIGLLFGSMYNWVGNTGSVSMTIAVVDEDQSEMSARFLDTMEKSDGITLVPLERDEAMDNVRRGRIVGMIVLPEGYGEKAGLMWEAPPAIELGIDPARKAEAGMLEGLVMQASGTLMIDRFEDPASLRPMIQELREELAAGEPAEEELDEALRPYLLQMLTALDSFMGSWEDVREAENNLVDEASAEGGNEDSARFSACTD